MTKKRERHKRWELTCHLCGAKFSAWRIDAITCSARCRKRLARRRKAGVDGIHPAAGRAMRTGYRGQVIRYTHTSATPRDYKLGLRERDEAGNYVGRRTGRNRFREG